MLRAIAASTEFMRSSLNTRLPHRQEIDLHASQCMNGTFLLAVPPSGNRSACAPLREGDSCGGCPHCQEIDPHAPQCMNELISWLARPNTKKLSCKCNMALQAGELTPQVAAPTHTKGLQQEGHWAPPQAKRAVSHPNASGGDDAVGRVRGQRSG